VAKGKNLQAEKFCFLCQDIFGQLSLHINTFFLSTHFKVSAVWYCSNYLPQVSLILVVHFDLRISLRFKKISMAPTLFSGVWGKMIHAKNLKQNISLLCPFKMPKKPLQHAPCISLKFKIIKEFLKLKKQQGPLSHVPGIKNQNYT
jgi:hypothetical protein